MFKWLIYQLKQLKMQSESKKIVTRNYCICQLDWAANKFNKTLDVLFVPRKEIIYLRNCRLRKRISVSINCIDWEAKNPKIGKPYSRQSKENNKNYLYLLIRFFTFHIFHMEVELVFKFETRFAKITKEFFIKIMSFHM
jgi:hypothetical protein